MANKNPNYSHSTQNVSPIEQDVDVLYQKLGDRWFAFSIIEDDVFMAPVPEEVLGESKPARTHLPEV